MFVDDSCVDLKKFFSQHNAIETHLPVCNKCYFLLIEHTQMLPEEARALYAAQFASMSFSVGDAPPPTSVDYTPGALAPKFNDSDDSNSKATFEQYYAMTAIMAGKAPSAPPM